MKRALIILAVLTMALVMITGTAFAKTILFPVLTVNPGNVSSLISVINTSNSTSVTQLHYRYFSKLASASISATCEEYDFYRPTTMNDIVTFDATGTLAGVSGGGTAMFNDATSYAGGVNAPYFHLANVTAAAPKRAFLLVTHANSNADLADGGSTIDLDGEWALIDVVNGAAWGGRAVQPLMGVLDTTTDFRNYIETLRTGATENYTQMMAIYPPNLYTTKFFFTPVDGAQDTAGTGGGDSRFSIMTAGTSTTAYGMYDRNENPVSGGSYVHIICLGEADLSTIVGSTIVSVLNTQGGWGWGLLDSTYNMAVVWKLEYGNAITGVSGMINTAEQIRTPRVSSTAITVQ